MKNKYLNLIGLASVARKTVSGETMFKSIKSVVLIIIASDASANTKKKIINKCQFYHIPYYIVEETSDVLGKAMGKEFRVAVGITDRGFAGKIKEIIGG